MTFLEPPAKHEVSGAPRLYLSMAMHSVRWILVQSQFLQDTATVFSLRLFTDFSMRRGEKRRRYSKQRNRSYLLTSLRDTLSNTLPFTVAQYTCIGEKKYYPKFLSSAAKPTYRLAPVNTQIRGCKSLHLPVGRSCQRSWLAASHSTGFPPVANEIIKSAPQTGNKQQENRLFFFLLLKDLKRAVIQNP